MRIVALTGPAGSGKSTFASHLVLHYNFVRVSFAAPLYDMLEAGGFGRPTTLEQKEAIILSLGFSWRYAAQTLGTEWGRKYLGEDIWANLALKKLHHDGSYVFDDLRFENEAKVLREAGALIVHLQDRGGAMASNTKGHASEAGIQRLGGDYVFSNSGPIQALHEFASHLLYGADVG